MPAVLFVCTANQFRSPIAAACFKVQIAGEEDAQAWRVESAGTWSENGLGPPGFTLQVARLLGLRGLRGHRTRQLTSELLDGFDLILVMESGQKEAICAEFPSACERVYLLPEVVDGYAYDIPDPTKSRTDPLEIGGIIRDLIARGREKIIALAQAHRRE